jgi:uncharacterized protein (TIGR02300 family)
MTKPELGTKRICLHCGAKFYDLHQSPVVCPKCDKVFEPTQITSRIRPGAPPAPKVKPAAESQKPALVASKDIGREEVDEGSEAEDEVASDDEGFDDAAFVEERENTDVTEIVGDDTKKAT